MTRLINNAYLSKPLTALMGVALLASSVSAQQIEFNIHGVNSNNGKLYVQLFSGEQAYDNGQVVTATIIKAKQGSTSVTFSDIEPGEYALRFFHDENNNGNLETNLLGMPTEGYGYSNNAKPNFGPVSYSKIKFLVTEQDQVVVNDTKVIY